MMPGVLNCDMAPAPCYPEGYAIPRPLELHLPFSSLYAAHLDKTFKQPFLEIISGKRNLARQKSSGELFDCSSQTSSIQRDMDASLTPPLAIINTCIHFDLDAYIADFSKIYTGGVFGEKNSDSQAFEWILREGFESNIIQHPSDLHTLCWKREEELKAQVSLALLCLSPLEINQEVNALKAGRPPNRSFNEDLALRCCSSLMPTKSFLEEVGATEAWLQKFKGLLNLLPPVGSEGLMFMLQTLHDLALFVIIPLQLDSEQLSSLATWFQEESKKVGLPTILGKVVASLPNMNKLGNEHGCKCWVEFLCSVLKRYPDLASLPKNDLVKILHILMTSPSPSCMMGHVMFQLLNSCCLSTARVPQMNGPTFMNMLLNTTEPLINEEWGDEMNHAGNILLSDQLYHNLRGTIAPVLLGREHAEKWDCADFDRCLCLALQACEDDVPFSLRKITALAFMKSFLYSAASVLNQVYMRRAQQDGKHHYKSVHLPTSISILSSISSTLRHAIQVFFMKVLHWDFGLSASDIANLLNYCENEGLLLHFSCLLDHPLLRNVRNRLGFNPFTGSSNAYMTADLALKKLVSGNEGQTRSFSGNTGQEELKYFFKSPGQEEQTAFIAAIASNLFVMKSGGPLSDAELDAMKWLRDTSNKSNWDPLLKQSLRYLMTDEPGGLWYDRENLSSDSLSSRCLTLDILVKVAALPAGSPLRGYSMLDPAHFMEAYMLAGPDNALQGVAGIGPFREYVCECGYIYIIGECTKPNEVGTCPQCQMSIGGTGHSLLPGNTSLRTFNSGRVIDSSVAAKPAFTIRIQPRSYRLLHVLVHYCLLIGAVTGGDIEQLAIFLEQPNDTGNIMHVLTDSIETDMLVLDKLLACQRERTYLYIHSILQSLSQITLQGPLLTVHQRDQWELAFEKIVESRPTLEVISEYLQSKGADGLNNLLHERSPCPPASLQDHFRMTRIPCLSHYETMFVQSREKAAQYPCITAVLAHATQLSSLSFLLPIVKFSATLHQMLGHNITRHDAAVTTVHEILQGRGDAEEKYDAFEACWNSIRLDVEGYECRQFREPIPVMHKNQPVALCLLERKDQGIYLTAILELLRTRQNAFLEDVKTGYLECGSTKFRLFNATDVRCMPSVLVQFCKAAQIVDYQEPWANDLVSELGTCNQTYGNGTQVQYEDFHIEIEMYRRLIQGKALLKGDYVEFPYQQESFQRHATLISDVVELIAQEALPLEKLNSISRELTVEGLGAGQLLAILELCLGFLHRTNADPYELLREYCNRWLDREAHPIFSKAVFDEVQVRHVVSLYEGLEEAASSAVEDLVTASYRSDLDAETRADLRQCVVVKKAGWGRMVDVASSSKAKLGAEAFRDVLRRFMFRYLTADTFKPNEELSLYLTDPRLVAWPAQDVDTETLDDIFPSSFQLRHARALYLALKEMCGC